MAQGIEIPAHVAYEIIDGEAVLLNLHTGVYFGLNASGTRALELLKRTRDSDQVLAMLADEYPIDAERLKSDLASWLDDLERGGLILRSAVANGQK